MQRLTKIVNGIRENFITERDFAIKLGSKLQLQKSLANIKNKLFEGGRTRLAYNGIS